MYATSVQFDKVGQSDRVVRIFCRKLLLGNDRKSSCQPKKKWLDFDAEIILYRKYVGRVGFSEPRLFKYVCMDMDRIM